MTELSREQIEEVRRGFPHSDALSAICDMALAKKDAERRAERSGGLARYWRHWAENYAGQAQRAETKCERLESYVLQRMERIGELLRQGDVHMALAKVNADISALSAPPPKSEPEKCPECGGRGLVSAVDWVEHHPVLAAEPCPRCSDDAPHTPEHWIGTWDEQADVPLCDWKPGMRNTPEQADSYPLDSEGRCLKCGGTGRIGVDSTREPCPACTSLPSQQAHGDALAALVDEIAPPIPPFNSEAEEEEYHCEAAVRHYSERVREKLRRHLTASGVPGHWACKNPGRADQYRAEAMACRRALGFDEESHDVSPTDLTSAIADSGVPYVPESIKRLPARLRSLAEEEEYEANKLHGMDEESSVRMARAEAYRDAAGRIGVYLKDALASAPADGWKLVPVEPTEEMLAAVDEAQMEHSANSLGADLPFEQAWAEALAAAPTDGRE